MGIKKEERVGVGSGRDRSDLNREEESEWGLSEHYRGRCPEPRAKLLPLTESGHLAYPRWERQGAGRG